MDLKEKLKTLLSLYPNLSLLGEKWLLKEMEKFEKKQESHKLGEILSKYILEKPAKFDEAFEILADPKDKRYVGAYLFLDTKLWYNTEAAYLNGVLNKVKGEAGMGKVLDDLRNKDQFFDTVSEIEFASSFIERYKVKLRPRIFFSKTKFREFDCSIVLDKREVFFDVITPKLPEELKPGKAVFIKEKLKNKILDKVDQYEPIMSTIKNPVVVVVNSSYSGIDDIEVENVLNGQTQITLTIDTKSGKAVDVSETRADNSINKTKPQSSLISAILSYKNLIRFNGSNEFKKDIFLNDKAKPSLSPKEYKKLTNFSIKQ